MGEGFNFERCRNYIGLHGSYIDMMALKDLQIPEIHKNNRLTRDGLGYHITVISPPELRVLVDKRDETISKKQFLKSITAKVAEQYGDIHTWAKPIDLGLGTCQDANEVSYFKVIHWPLGQNIRNIVYGLEKTYHFHITVGFHPRDVHLYKGPGALCDLRNLSCSEERLKSLIALVPFYWNDGIFITALYKQCAHLKAVKQSLKLSKLCILAYVRYIYLEFKKRPNLKKTSMFGAGALLGLFAFTYYRKLK